MPLDDQSKRRVKVAVVIGALEVGGAELDIVRNFPRLNRGEFEVVLICFAEPGELAPQVEGTGIAVVSRRPARFGVSDRRQEQSESAVDFVAAGATGSDNAGRTRIHGVLVPRLLQPVVSALAIANVTIWVARTLAKQEVDIMHAFLPHSYAYGMIGCAIARPKAKTVMSRLSLNFYRDSHRALAWLERNVLHRFVDIAIGNSRVILDELADEGVDPHKLRLLRNGIDPAPFARQAGDRERARAALGLHDSAFVIVAVGNLHAYKGHRDLIEACALASDELPHDWFVLIAGRDQRGNQAVYEELILQRGLTGRVRLLGACDDIRPVLWAADLFVHPSHHEGLPNAIVEAMAASLPVIGTTVGGIPEAVLTCPTGGDAAEETGWLVAPHDPDALAAAVVEAAGDPARRRQMGEHARGRVLAEFSLDESVGAYEAIYRELMS